MIASSIPSWWKRREFMMGLAAGLLTWMFSSLTSYVVRSAVSTTTMNAATTTISKQTKHHQHLSQPQQSFRQKKSHQQQLIFIHIGKTGGSSVRCMLHPLLGEGSCVSRSTAAADSGETTAIRNQTMAVCHQTACTILILDNSTSSSNHSTETPSTITRKVLGRPNIQPNHWIIEQTSTLGGYGNGGVIVSVRNPVARIISWFLYGRGIYIRSGTGASTSNLKVGSNDRYRQQQIRENQVYRCYDEFADLAEAIRLMMMTSANNNFDDEISESSSNNTANPSAAATTAASSQRREEQCQAYARRCVEGTMYCATHHNKQNYKYYLKPLLSKLQEQDQRQYHGANTTDIYVVRNENKWEDFHTINLMLGGTATSFYPSSSSPSSQLPHARKNGGSSNRTIPTLARPSLCKVLCDEIHVYLAVLKRAINLHERQYMQTLKELYESCGLTSTDEGLNVRLRHRALLPSSEDPLSDLCGTNPYVE